MGTIRRQRPIDSREASLLECGALGDEAVPATHVPFRSAPDGRKRTGFTMFRSARYLLPVALVASAGLSACEISETCDPDVDLACDNSSDAGNDFGGDTTAGCGTLQEGASRCEGADAVATCSGGSLNVAECGTGSYCGPDASCTPVYRYLMVSDLSSSQSPPNPGADVDAVELIHGGQSYYGTRVTDSFIPTDVVNETPDPSEAIGQPDIGGGESHACDYSNGHAHWVSLGGGQVVFSFDGNQPVQDGDTVIVYECGRQGSTGIDDPFEIALGSGSRIDDTGWVTIVDSAQGYFPKQVDFGSDGLPR